MRVKKMYYLLLYHWHFAKAYYYGKDRHYKKYERYEQKLFQLNTEKNEQEK